ncbi:uncharacterized protein LOC143746345 [Siphateles boraxobius]|uniref:uncharacterized protein LOC143746345 n=1 Tax=Siphateles boraxobius TaxID=180520 RepID=UPI0040628EB4
MSMFHMIGKRGGRPRSRRAAFSQTAGQEVWRPGSDDRDQDPLPDSTQTQIQELPGDLTPLFSEFSVSVSTGQSHRKKAWQSGSQQMTDDGHPSTSSKRSPREKPTEHWKRKGIVSFLNRVWKATKSNFPCC